MSVDHVRRINIARAENAGSRQLSVTEKRMVARQTGCEYKPVDHARNTVDGYAPDASIATKDGDILGYSIKTPTSREQISLHSYHEGKRALDVDENTAYLKDLQKTRIAQAHKCQQAHDLRNASKRKLNEYNAMSNKFVDEWLMTWVDALADDTEGIDG